MTRDAPTLGLVVPVWNDRSGADRVLAQAREMGIFARIVVVDDGSDEAVLLPEGSGRDRVELLRHPTPRGPGAARNAGAERLDTSHVLFFDSDDLFTPELPRLWRDLAERQFDLCLFRHVDSRISARGRWGQTLRDDALWRIAGMGGLALAAPGGAARAALAQTANYPWNRISRLDFLRDRDIRFSEIMVHEDIAPHWRGFARADRILASDRIAAIHHVAAEGGRLTNRRGRERLALFDPLIGLGEELSVRADLFAPFLTFCSGLFDWIAGQLDPAYHHAFFAGIRRFLHQVVSGDRLRRLARQDPVTALRLGAQALQGGAAC